MIQISDVISWKYGNFADTVNGKITRWYHKDIAQPDEVQLAIDRQEYINYLASEAYKNKREAALPRMHDMVQVVYEVVDYLKKKGGVDIGPRGEAFIAYMEKLNKDFPPIQIQPDPVATEESELPIESEPVVAAEEPLPVEPENGQSGEELLPP